MAQSHTTAPESAATQSSGLPAGIHFFTWGTMILLAMVLVGLSQSGQDRNAWEGWRESSELRRPAYAERVYMNAVFRTRANTWSNLAYVLVGLYGIEIGRHDLRCRHPVNGNYVMGTPAMSILFGVTCCYLGFGSGLFHASLTRWGQQLDVAAMYSPLTVFLAINVGRWIHRLKTEDREGSFPAWPILVGLVLVANYLLYEYKWSMRSGVVMRNLILGVACFALLDRFQRRRKLSIRWLLLSATALVLGRVCWQLDVAGKFSGPDAWLQGHAVWHLLTALSLASSISTTVQKQPARDPQRASVLKSHESHKNTYEATVPGVGAWTVNHDSPGRPILHHRRYRPIEVLR